MHDDPGSAALPPPRQMEAMNWRAPTMIFFLVLVAGSDGNGCRPKLAAYYCIYLVFVSSGQVHARGFGAVGSSITYASARALAVNMYQV